MAGRKIRINEAGVHELMDLRGVGSVTAQRITEWRDRNGPLRSPFDLAEVDGISLRQAELIGDAVDWSVPSQPDSERSAFLTVFLSLVLVLGVYVVWRQLVSLAILLSAESGQLNGRAVTITEEGYYSGPLWFNLWLSVSALGALTFWTLSVIAWIGLALSNRKKWDRWWARAGFGLLVPCAVLIVSVGLANAVLYSFYSPRGWSTILKPAPLAGFLVGFRLVVDVLSVVVCVRRPELLQRPALRVAADSVSLGVVVAAALWVFVEGVPPLVWVAQLLIGATEGGIALAALKTNRSMLQGRLEVIGLERLPETADRHRHWQEWINRRLPSPEDQQALAEAILRAHPRSRARSGLLALIIAIAGWLVLSSIGAIVEMFVQRWWDTLFGLIAP